MRPGGRLSFNSSSLELRSREREQLAQPLLAGAAARPNAEHRLARHGIGTGREDGVHDTVDLNIQRRAVESRPITPPLDRHERNASVGKVVTEL